MPPWSNEVEEVSTTPGWENCQGSDIVNEDRLIDGYKHKNSFKTTTGKVKLQHDLVDKGKRGNGKARCQ